ncbi:MAG: DUF3320 domain-containing protein [Dehalococcoidia bacterium]|nr:DUF3320 domain-containing protein [Dehalococcoidia bacterium]
MVRPALRLDTARRPPAATLGAYLRLTKPRVIELLLVTAVPPMLLAHQGLPPWWLIAAVVVGGALAAGGANAINCWIERDRDRLRQEILEQRGWRIHRIWSLDWFRQPQRELNRLAEAIQQARQASALAEVPSPGARESSPCPLPVPDPGPPRKAADCSEGWVIDRRAVQDQPAIATVPYTVTTLTLRAPRPFPDLPTSEQVRIIRQIVQTEGPIHAEEICQRAATLTGMQRAGSRVRESVEALLVQGQRQGWLVASNDFYSLPGQPSRLRDRSEAPSSTLRSPAMVPPDELAAAIVAVVEKSVGAAPDEIAREVARLLGVKQGLALRQALDRQFTRLAQSGSLQWQAGRWTLAPAGRQATG